MARRSHSGRLVSAVAALFVTSNLYISPASGGAPSGGIPPEGEVATFPAAEVDDAAVVVWFRSAMVRGLIEGGAEPRDGVGEPARLAAERVRATMEAHGAVGARAAFECPPQDGALAARLGLDRVAIVTAAPGRAGVLATALAALTDEVEGVEGVHLGRTLGNVPNDPLFNSQYALCNGEHPGADIHALGAWRRSLGSPGVTIAIVDTGISHSHPELAPNLLPGRNFTYGNPDNADDSVVFSHGTFVAGVAGAIGGNGVGIAGTCWNARLLPVRVANQFGVSSDAHCAAGIVWAADQGARVINVSMGFPTAGRVLELAVEYASLRGALVCASSGNTPGLPIYAPARYPNVVCVGATDQDDRVPSFVTTGLEMDICAPGVDILTTQDTALNPNGFTMETGTSMSCPFVAGAAALVWSVNPELTSEQVRTILLATADDIGSPGWDPESGWGRLNVERAVQLADARPRTPCEVDWNSDGNLNSPDFFSFLEDYMRFEADYNRDGTTDSADFFEYVTAFLAGC